MRKLRTSAAILVCIAITAICISRVRSPSPAPPAIGPQSFRLGDMVEFKPGDPRSLIPPVAVIATITDPPGKISINSTEKIRCAVNIKVPPGAEKPSLVMFNMVDQKGGLHGSTLGVPARRESDGTYSLTGSFGQTIRRRHYKLYAQAQVIYLTGQGVRDENAVIKPYYFDSQPVEIEVR